jgi:hypothetical protein
MNEDTMAIAWDDVQLVFNTTDLVVPDKTAMKALNSGGELPLGWRCTGVYNTGDKTRILFRVVGPVRVPHGAKVRGLINQLRRTANAEAS